MYRILQCDKDAYILDKIIKSSRSLDSNTGMAGTLDLYNLFNETFMSGSDHVYEKTRILTHFDLAPLYQLTSSFLNINNPSFKCFLSLNDIYHGLPVPSNFTISIFPLARFFNEGRGFDVVEYRDKDATNWLTASITNGIVDTWAVSGANQAGGLGTSNIDYFSSGNLGSGIVSLSSSYTFNRGDENLYLDITTIVSATLAGILPDYGLRISLNNIQDNNEKTYFVKRFASRHVKNPFIRPKINVFFDNSFIDNQVDAYTDIVNTFSFYNKVLGTYRNFFSGAAQITGSNSLMFNMMSSRSLTVWTSSYSQTHSQSINHLTNSIIYFSTSFTGSQLSLGGTLISGSYMVNVTIDPNSNNWQTFVNATNWDGSGKIQDVNFATEWKSIDQTLLYSSGSGIQIKRLKGNNNNVFENNFIVNITNLKQTYSQNEFVRLRVFVQDFNTELKYYKLPVDLTSNIYSNMFWRLINSNTKEIVIPFETNYNSTKLSSDGLGMYFDLYMQDLPTNQIYEIEFLIKENNKDYYITNNGFKFKVLI